MHTNPRTHIYIQTCIRTYTHRHMCAHTYTHIHTNMHTHTRIHIHTYTHTHTHTYTHIHTNMHTHIHTRTHMRAQPIAGMTPVSSEVSATQPHDTHLTWRGKQNPRSPAVTRGFLAGRRVAEGTRPAVRAQRRGWRPALPHQASPAGQRLSFLLN